MRGKPSKSGLIACAGVAILATAVWGGLELARRSIDTTPATGVPPGIAAHPVSILAACVNRDASVVDRLLKEIASKRPDFLLLQRVEQSDMTRLAAAMKIAPEASGSARGGIVFDISVNAEATDGEWGNAILATVPLYEARAIPNEGGGSIGVWAACVMDGRRFRVASVDLLDTSGDDAERSRGLEIDHYRQAWSAAGNEPTILATRANGNSPIGADQASGTQAAGDERIVVSSPWKLDSSVTQPSDSLTCVRVMATP